jgi:hypothetical protein
VLVDNEVDGVALFNLTDADVMAIFPGKVGVSRKLITMLKTVKEPTVQVMNNTVNPSVVLTPNIKVLTSTIAHSNY